MNYFVMYYHERFAKFKYYERIGVLYKGLQWQNDTTKKQYSVVRTLTSFSKF